MEKIGATIGILIAIAIIINSKGKANNVITTLGSSLTSLTTTLQDRTGSATNKGTAYKTASSSYVS
jgi:hypothetical protein